MGGNNSKSNHSHNNQQQQQQQQQQPIVSITTPSSSTTTTTNVQVKLPKLVGGKTEVLNEEYIKSISRYLPSNEYRDEWRLLFSSTANGHSFNRFVHHIADKGSTLIIIKEEGGHIFGGFTEEMWKFKYPKFYGNVPEIHIYQPTGLDKNFQYLNEGTTTLFNGVGMGGIEYLFGWAIEDNFEYGHSKGSPEILECGDGKDRSSTYGNLNLGSTKEFKVEYVEVWLLKERVLTEDEILEREYKKKKAKSILDDEDNADKMIKGMMGHEFSVYNEDIKEKDKDKNKQQQQSSTT
eukprot:gene4618-5769_t